MSDLRAFCYQSCQRVMTALYQELQLQPSAHYQPVGYNAARVLSLRLVGINPHYLGKIKSMQSELTLWAGLPDKYKVRIGHDTGAIIIEIPKPKTFWKQITIEDMETRHFIRRGAIATLGLGLQDEPKRVNFTQEAMAHVFIAGQTRSGKTNTQRLIAWNLAHNTNAVEVKMLIFDVAKKGFKWHDFGMVANLLHPIIIDIEMADRVLAWLNAEIERRATERYVSPRIFVIIDELKALLDTSRVAGDYLSRIASVGGEFGLHLVLSTQYPQIQMLKNAELKRNVTTRLCGRVDDAQAATNALGVPDSGAETLGGYGDFLLKDLSGISRLTVVHLQPRHMEVLPKAEIVSLPLPHSDVVNDGPKLTRQPDEIEPEQIALALFNPMSINKLQTELNVGGSKATRIKRYADRIRQWAIEHGYRCLET